MENQSQAALQLLGSLTGVAIVIAGFLYLVGILVTSAELWHAGVSVRDTIPILSLDQLLGRGVSLVLPTLALLAAAALGMAIYWTLEKRLQDGVRGRLEGLASNVPEREREAWLAEATEANERTDWSRLSQSLKQAQRHAADPARGELAKLRRRARRANLPVNLLFVAMCAIVWFLPPALAAAVLLTGAAWLLLGARPLPHLLAVGYAVLVVALLADPWVDPRDLPTATIATDDGKVVCGRFLFIKDGEWFVATPSHALRVVEPDDVRWARIERGEPRRSVFELIDDKVNPGAGSGRRHVCA